MSPSSSHQITMTLFLSLIISVSLHNQNTTPSATPCSIRCIPGSRIIFSVLKFAPIEPFHIMHCFMLLLLRLSSMSSLILLQLPNTRSEDKPWMKNSMPSCTMVHGRLFVSLQKWISSDVNEFYRLKKMLAKVFNDIKHGWWPKNTINNMGSTMVRLSILWWNHKQFKSSCL